MDIQKLTSLVNEIIRDSKYGKIETLDGLALFICWYHGSSFNGNFSHTDFVDLYSDGESAYHSLVHTLTDEQRKLIYDNWETITEILNDKYIEETLYVSTITFPMSMLLSHLLSVEEDEDWCDMDMEPIYNPFGGDLHIAQIHRNWYIRLQDRYPSHLRFYELYLIAKKRAQNFDFYPQDPFDEKNPDMEYKYMYIPAIPLGKEQRENKKAIKFVLKALNRLEEGGRMIVSFPTTSLMSEDFYEFREELIISQKLKYVINFMPGSYSQYSNVAMTAYVIDNSTHRERFFSYVDLSNTELSDQNAGYGSAMKIRENDTSIVKQVSFENIINTKDYSLSEILGKAAHIKRENVKYIKLRDVIRPYRQKSILDGTEMVFRLSGKDMHLQSPKCQLDIGYLGLESLKGRFTCIEEPVFCFHSITRKHVWFKGEEKHPAFCNNDIYVFQLDNEFITPEYLCFILSEDDIVADIQSKVVGVTPRISREDFLDVVIPIPDDDSVEAVGKRIADYVSDFKSKLFVVKEKEIEETIDDIREDIEDKKHLLAPYNSDIQLGLNRILKILREGRALDAQTKVFRQSDVTAADFLESLLRKSINHGYITASIGGSIFEPVIKPLSVDQFLIDYENYLKNDDCYKGIDISLDIKDPNVFLMIDQKALHIALDTITRNALAHGFSNPFIGQKRLRISLTLEPKTGMAVLSIANNGNPVTEKFSQTLYTSKFGRSGPNANTGRGGFFINKAMKYYEGDISINTKDKEWPFIISLYIPYSHE